MGEGDKAGLAAIKALHHQLDDDHDGTIEPQETGDFIKADLKVIACQGSMRSCRYIYEHEGKKEKCTWPSNIKEVLLVRRHDVLNAYV